MKMDIADALRVVQSKSTESEAYIRQLHIWLGVGSAGGAISMVSLAANLSDPAYVFHFLQPSLWSFLIGVVTAGASLFFLSLRADAIATHHAAAHNRDQANDALSSIPEVISSPRRIADEANQGRNKLIEISHKEHAHAEQAWKLKRFYSFAWATCLGISALAFIVGFAWPLAQVSFFEASLLP